MRLGRWLGLMLVVLMLMLLMLVMMLVLVLMLMLVLRRQMGGLVLRLRARVGAKTQCLVDRGPRAGCWRVEGETQAMRLCVE